MISKASHPPAFCPEHGLFPATALALQNVTAITFTHCQTNCPVPECDQACEIIPGQYSADDKGRLDLLLDPSISPEALAALKDIIEKVRDGQLAPATIPPHCSHKRRQEFFLDCSGWNGAVAS
jgi:hypothetical protein